MLLLMKVWEFVPLNQQNAFQLVNCFKLASQLNFHQQQHWSMKTLSVLVLLCFWFCLTMTNWLYIIHYSTLKISHTVKLPRGIVLDVFIFTIQMVARKTLKNNWNKWTNKIRNKATEVQILFSLISAIVDESLPATPIWNSWPYTITVYENVTRTV